MAEGETVEFDIVHDEKKGKSSASNVTGPAGAFVKGAPRQQPQQGWSPDRRGGGGGGSRGGGRRNDF